MHPSISRVICSRPRCNIPNPVPGRHVLRRPGKHIMYTSPGRLPCQYSGRHAGLTLCGRLIPATCRPGILRPCRPRKLCRRNQLHLRNTVRPRHVCQCHGKHILHPVSRRVICIRPRCNVCHTLPCRDIFQHGRPASLHPGPGGFLRSCPRGGSCPTMSRIHDI